MDLKVLPLEKKNVSMSFRAGGWSADVYYALGEHTLRVRIRDDFYASQSFAVLERWDGASWANVATAPQTLVHGKLGRRGEDEKTATRLAALYGEEIVKEFGWVIV